MRPINAALATTDEPSETRFELAANNNRPTIGLIQSSILVPKVETVSIKTMTPEFTRKTMDLIARRASFICSNPDCRVRTVGANTDPEKSSLIGQSALIYGARPSAKRFDPKSNNTARASITKAIWLCSNGHKHVDSMDDYLEQVAILGAKPLPEYATFSPAAAEKGLRTALDEANAKFKDL